jgi:hypothetical protein
METPTFFIPDAQDAAEAEKAYAGIKIFAEEQLGWKINDRRIFSLRYRHEGSDYAVQVGLFDDRIQGKVVAILQTEHGVCLVCSEKRGYRSGAPMLVGTAEVYELVLFVASP